MVIKDVFKNIRIDQRIMGITLFALLGLMSILGLFLMFISITG